jgi:putative effector of murein hydrolase
MSDWLAALFRENNSDVIMILLIGLPALIVGIYALYQMRVKLQYSWWEIIIGVFIWHLIFKALGIGNNRRK